MVPLSLVVVVVHELAHGLTTTHYGREVPRGGFLLYLAAPGFFMDTSDVWMAPTRARIASAFAGVFSGFVLGGLCALALLAVEPDTLIAGLLYQVASIGYADTAVNLVPLLELDGYYILVDLLDMPRLRQRSFAFLRHLLVGKLARRERLTPDERLFAVYGVLAAVSTVLAVALALALWEAQLALIAEDLMRHPAVGSALGLVVLLSVFGGPLLLRASGAKTRAVAAKTA